MAYGIESTGFNEKPIETIKTEVEDSLKTNVDSALNVTATSLLGQIIGILSSKLSELWEVAHGVYSAFDPDAAEGASLDVISSLTGTIREAATKSTVTATININNGVTVPVGAEVYYHTYPSGVSVDAEGKRLQLIAERQVVGVVNE